MSEIKETLVSKELNFQKAQVAQPQYQMVRITPQMSNSVSAQASSSADVVFEIPTKSINWTKSYLQCGDMTPDTAPAANHVHVMSLDSFPCLTNVNWATKGATPLLDMKNYAQQYLKLMNPREESYAKYIRRDIDDSLFYPSNTLAGTNNQTSDGKCSAITNYDENTHSIISDVATVLDPLVNARFSLKDLKNTVMSLDKPIMMPEITLLTFTFGYANRFIYDFVDTAGDAKINSSAGANPQLGAVWAQYTGNVAIHNIELHLCVDTSASAMYQLEQIESKGYSLIVPYPVFNWQNVPSATSQNIGITFQRSQGKNLRKIYHTVFAVQSAAAPQLTNNNLATEEDGVSHLMVPESPYIGGAIVESYHTELNSTRLQPYDLFCKQPCTDYADWKEKYKNQDNAILSKAQFYANWCHIDDWTNGRLADNERMGLPLSTEVKWDFMATTSQASYNHFTAAILERELIVSRQGVAVTSQ